LIPQTSPFVPESFLLLEMRSSPGGSPPQLDRWPDEHPVSPGKFQSRRVAHRLVDYVVYPPAPHEQRGSGHGYSRGYKNWPPKNFWPLEIPGIYTHRRSQMPIRKAVTMLLRAKSDGVRRYLKPCIVKGKPKPQWGLLGTKPTHFPNSRYAVRYWLQSRRGQCPGKLIELLCQSRTLYLACTAGRFVRASASGLRVLLSGFRWVSRVPSVVSCSTRAYWARIREVLPRVDARRLYGSVTHSGLSKLTYCR
jgi:hypothetical protein